jgi:hypothetical protein
MENSKNDAAIFIPFFVDENVVNIPSWYKSIIKTYQGNKDVDFFIVSNQKFNDWNDSINVKLIHIDVHEIFNIYNSFQKIEKLKMSKYVLKNIIRAICGLKPWWLLDENNVIHQTLKNYNYIGYMDYDIWLDHNFFTIQNGVLDSFRKNVVKVISPIVYGAMFQLWNKNFLFNSKDMIHNTIVNYIKNGKIATSEEHTYLTILKQLSEKEIFNFLSVYDVFINYYFKDIKNFEKYYIQFIVENYTKDDFDMLAKFKNSVINDHINHFHYIQNSNIKTLCCLDNIVKNNKTILEFDELVECEMYDLNSYKIIYRKGNVISEANYNV